MPPREMQPPQAEAMVSLLDHEERARGNHRLVIWERSIVSGLFIAAAVMMRLLGKATYLPFARCDEILAQVWQRWL